MKPPVEAWAARARRPGGLLWIGVPGETVGPSHVQIVVGELERAAAPVAVFSYSFAAPGREQPDAFYRAAARFLAGSAVRYLPDPWSSPRAGFVAKLRKFERWRDPGAMVAFVIDAAHLGLARDPELAGLIRYLVRPHYLWVCLGDPGHPAVADLVVRAGADEAAWPVGSANVWPAETTLLSVATADAAATRFRADLLAAAGRVDLEAMRLLAAEHAALRRELLGATPLQAARLGDVDRAIALCSAPERLAKLCLLAWELGVQGRHADAAEASELAREQYEEDVAMASGMRDLPRCSPALSVLAALWPIAVPVAGDPFDGAAARIARMRSGVLRRSGFDALATRAAYLGSPGLASSLRAAFGDSWDFDGWAATFLRDIEEDKAAGGSIDDTIGSTHMRHGSLSGEAWVALARACLLAGEDCAAATLLENYFNNWCTTQPQMPEFSCMVRTVLAEYCNAATPEMAVLLAGTPGDERLRALALAVAAGCTAEHERPALARQALAASEEILAGVLAKEGDAGGEREADGLGELAARTPYVAAVVLAEIASGWARLGDHGAAARAFDQALAALADPERGRRRSDSEDAIHRLGAALSVALAMARHGVREAVHRLLDEVRQDAEINHLPSHARFPRAHVDTGTGVMRLLLVLADNGDCGGMELVARALPDFEIAQLAAATLLLACGREAEARSAIDRTLAFTPPGPPEVEYVPLRRDAEEPGFIVSPYELDVISWAEGVARAGKYPVLAASGAGKLADKVIEGYRQRIDPQIRYIACQEALRQGDVQYAVWSVLGSNPQGKPGEWLYGAYYRDRALLAVGDALRERADGLAVLAAARAVLVGRGQVPGNLAVLLALAGDPEGAVEVWEFEVAGREGQAPLLEAALEMVGAFRSIARLRAC
ncbi:MAG: hypothetical protein FJZ01_15890 [Candidatus Sericytochromatia bacterium]|nr:hypothetical protein [Candidatus Tanganyikabacteria bacterium]